MLTRLKICNFKILEEVDIELGDRVLFIGPNNSGKSSALQALVLWDIGVKRWFEKRSEGNPREKRPGVTINRRDLIALPVPVANLLWRDLHVRERVNERGTSKTQNVLVDITVEGISGKTAWTCGLEFDYANQESFYCRPSRAQDGRITPPADASQLNIAYLPPMSGLAANETRLDAGAINVRVGEGRTAEVLRNLCYLVLQSDGGEAKWSRVVEYMRNLFGVMLEAPEYVKERGEVVMSYRSANKTRLDISCSGRGQQQTLLLLAHLMANPGAVLLLDEPDAHLEILRQRQIYKVLTDTADETGGQIIAASHSEVLLNETAERDTVIAFLGKRPHRIGDRGSQLLKSLREYGFEHYVLAEEKGWVLYLEGSTDLSILQTIAGKLGHRAADALRCPYVHYVGNQPRKAQEHYYALREAKRDVLGYALYDRLEMAPPEDPNLPQHMWSKREIENYICTRDVLLKYAEKIGEERYGGPIFAEQAKAKMDESISIIENALADLNKPSPWGADIKATDDFLDTLFPRFYKALDLPNVLSKTSYHLLAEFLAPDEISAEVVSVLDAIADTAAKANPSFEYGTGS